MPKISQTAKRARAANIVAGLVKRVRPAGTFLLDGKELSRKEIIAFFQAQIDAIDAIDAARAALRVAVSKERAVARAVTPALPLFRQALFMYFGREADALADFGMKPPRKPGPKTVAAKFAGAEKLRATRRARRTMGRRQREKVRA